MDLRGLRSFVTLARLNNITRAAETLHLSPAAVHKHLRNLEDELEVRLYEKVGRKLRLTAAAHVLLPHATDLLVRYDATMDVLKEWRGVKAGLVRLGSGPGTSTCILPVLLGEFRKAHPEVEVQVETGSTASLVRDLSESTLDIAIMVLPDPPECEGLRILVSWEFEIVLVSAAPGMPRRCSIHDLADQPFILFKQGSQVEKGIDSYLARYGVQPRVMMRFDSSEAIKAMLKLGTGVSMLPLWVLEAELHNGTLARIQQSEPPLHSRTIVAIRRGGYLPAAAAAFIEIARQSRFWWVCGAGA